MASVRVPADSVALSQPENWKGPKAKELGRMEESGPGQSFEQRGRPGPVRSKAKGQGPISIGQRVGQHERRSECEEDEDDEGLFHTAVAGWGLVIWLLGSKRRPHKEASAKRTLDMQKAKIRSNPRRVCSQFEKEKKDVTAGDR